MSGARVRVLGAGAWGTALAITARRAGADVTLWTRSQALAASIQASHGNPAYLPGIALDPAIQATVSDSVIAAGAELLVAAMPAQFLRAVLTRLRPHLTPDVPIVIAAKGVERGTGCLMSEIVTELLPGQPWVVLSGPTFAVEVARGLPTAVTLAAHDPVLATRVAEILGTTSFRPYVSADPVGSAIGGAVKNVLAIACGIVEGRGLGENARAALITRGLAEMMRLAAAAGADPTTLMGLSGLGDLTLTCTARQSRNYALGVGLGQGSALADLLAGRRSVVEGVASATGVAARARRDCVEMPLVAAVEAILHHGASIDGEIARLLSRPFRPETTLPLDASGVT